LYIDLQNPAVSAKAFLYMLSQTRRKVMLIDSVPSSQVAGQSLFNGLDIE